MITPTHTDPGDERGDLLHLHQMLSPAFPIGSFAYSQGLETAISGGDASGPDDVASWVAAVLAHGSGRSDAILLALARRLGADIPALDRIARALSPTSERLAETLEQGRAFAAQAAIITGCPIPALPLPLVVGLATAPIRVPTALVLGLWLHGLAAQLVLAAVRFLPLGQTDGQRILYDLAPRITDLADRFAQADLDDIATFTPGADLASMEHESLTVRIFRS
jgi:urease accessory protein